MRWSIDAESIGSVGIRRFVLRSVPLVFVRHDET